MIEPTNRALRSLKDLQSPTMADRRRVRDSLQRTLAAGATPESARRVMEAMQNAGTRGTTAWLANKWVVSAALIGAGAIGTAVWTSETEPVVHATASASAVPSAQPVVAAPTVSQPSDQPPNKASVLPVEAGPDSEASPVLAVEPLPTVRAAGSAPRHKASFRARSTSHTASAQAPVAPVAAPEPIPSPAAVEKSEVPQSASTAETIAPAPAAPAIRLAEELALLRRADAALRDKQANVALNALSAHASRFPNSALRIERVGLRAIALCMQNDPYAAQARNAFLNEHESSPLAARVRSACLTHLSETK